MLEIPVSNSMYATYFASSEHVNREIKTLNTHRVFSVRDRPERRKWSKVFCYICVWAIVTAKWTIVIINFKALLWNTHSNNSSKCNTYYILHTLLSSHCENCGKEFNKLFYGLILFQLRFYRTRMRCDAMRCWQRILLFWKQIAAFFLSYIKWSVGSES